MHSRCIQHQHCRTSSRRAGHHARLLPAPCATGGRSTGSTGRQKQQQGSDNAARTPAASSGRKAPTAGSSSSNTQQQQPDQPGGGQQFSSLDSAEPQLQYQTDDVYVAEPWEISEPWDDVSSWPGSAPGPSTQPQQQGGSSRGLGVNWSPASAGEQGSPLGSLDWLLEDEEGEDEGSEGVSDEDDGWLLDEPDSSGPLQQQDVQQRWQPLQQQEQPQVQQRQGPHQQPQQQQPALAVPVDLQASWEAALAVSLDVLASYDVRYDVIRPARISSSAAAGRAPSRQQTGEAGLGPEEVSLTAAAVAAARARRRRRRQKVRTVSSILVSS